MTQEVRVLYLLAVLLPPLAVLLAGKPFQALINIPLTIALWVPGMIHAIFVVHNHYADKRNERLIKAMERTQRRSSRS
jgi:uncharacterized membrane protein YqaE (UPF0057 family)